MLHLKKHCFIILLFCFFFEQALYTQEPSLVVGIMVDGLQAKHLEQLHERLGQGGLKKLTTQGTAFNRLACNYVASGNTTDIATLTSGTVPYYHAVVGDKIFRRNTQKIESIFQDNQQSGIESSLKLSAINFRASNIIDELIMANPGQSKAFAIGLNAEDMIAFGGHAANGVVWMDDEKMLWSSTNYYNEGMPWQALDMNVNGAFNRYVNRIWEPLYQPNTYIAAQFAKKIKPFEYKPSEKITKQSKQSILKSTPSANALVAELALRIFQEHELGMDKYTDALMLQFSVRTPHEQNLSLQTLEKEDIYLRLDDELQFLMQKIENKIGTDQVLFVLFGNQTASYSPEELKAHGLHAGYFNANRSIALLNAYLMAVYGYDKWVEGYYGKHIYLNKKLIAEKEIDFKQMQNLIIEFMIEFEGIQSAHSVQQLMNTAADPNSELAKIRNSIHQHSAGDIILRLMPGWLEVDDEQKIVGDSNDLIAYLPLWLYGNKMPVQTIKTDYQVTDISASLSEILNIPRTNANIGKPIELEQNKP